jgi:peptidoglycan biosynthesis protein MviN/MurJ (putative lipid II flippase)
MSQKQMIIELIFFICFVAANLTLSIVLEEDPTFTGLLIWACVNCVVLIAWMKKNKIKKLFQ